MTTATATRTTEYTVTFLWTAEDWEGCLTEDGEFDYDNQPDTQSAAVKVTLPSDATPWDVYYEADGLDRGPIPVDGVNSWDSDGMRIEFDGKCLFLSGYLIEPETQWSDFY